MPQQWEKWESTCMLHQKQHGQLNLQGTSSTLDDVTQTELDKNPRLFPLLEEIHDGGPKSLHCMKTRDPPNMVKSVIHQINLNHFSHARPYLLQDSVLDRLNDITSDTKVQRILMSKLQA